MNDEWVLAALLAVAIFLVGLMVVVAIGGTFATAGGCP